MKGIFLFILLCSFITSCRKNESDSNNNPVLIDQLSDEQIQNIEAGGIDTVSTYDNALFSDGGNMSEWEASNDSGYVYIFSLRTNPASDKKLLFINSMTHAGFKLTTRSNYSFPMQKGIAYVYNSKSFINASAYEKATCQEPLHGLDCSGMIYQMAKASGLNLSTGGTVDYVKITMWNTAFNNSPDFQGLEMTDLNALEPSAIQAGDIIVAPNNHMGMVFDNGSSLAIFNSLGTSKYSCAKNSDANHGPVISKNLSKWLQQSFGNFYHVLRVTQQGKPGLTTANISSLTEISAVSGGNITNDGGSPITARGVCWSTSHNPTIADDTTLNGSGTGTFTSHIIDLTADDTFYVRAYATNSAGTAYGNEVSFNTPADSISLLSGHYIGTATWTNYDGTGQNPQVYLEFNIIVDQNGAVSGTMTIDNHTGVAVGTASTSNISIQWTEHDAPFKYSGTFSSDRKTIEGSGGAGNYYAPLNANGPFKVSR